MKNETNSNITLLLNEINAGNKNAWNTLAPLIYEEMKTLAHLKLMNERQDITLDTIALVHEAFINLTKLDRIILNDRKHLYLIVAYVMKQIILNYAKAKKSQKRTMEFPIIRIHPGNEGFLERYYLRFEQLEDALEKLKVINLRAYNVVMYRFFVGLQIEEIAKLLKLSSKTIQRDWEMAKRWLSKNLHAHE